MEPTSATRPFATPTGEACPRTVRIDGTVEGSGDCLGCGTCLQLAELAYPEPVVAPEVTSR
jgi:hypothetical protein